MKKRTDVPGVIYLLHFSAPLKHARHYVGWTEDLDQRLATHGTDRGARLLIAVKEAGITWTLACTWPGTRADERRLKQRKNTPRLCPICQELPGKVTA